MHASLSHISHTHSHLSHSRITDKTQSPDVVNNTLHTGWLDARIAQRVTGPAASPPWHLAVVAGAVVRAFEHVSVFYSIIMCS